MNEPTSDIQLCVHCYQEDGDHVALALKMDLRGYGATIEEALDELRDLLVAQIAFAYFKKHPETIWFSAKQRYLDQARDRPVRIMTIPAATISSNRHRFKLDDSSVMSES